MWCSLRRALVAVALRGVMGCARAPGGPRLFLSRSCSWQWAGQGAVLQEQRPGVRLGAGFVASAANKIKQSVRIPLEIWGLLSGSLNWQLAGGLLQRLCWAACSWLRHGLGRSCITED